MNEKVILTDIDGVCLDWEPAFHEWMAARGHFRQANDVYRMSDQYSGIRFKKIERLVREFANCSWIGHIKPFRDARSGIARLVDEGYKFIAITSLSLDPYTKELRVRNLEELFGKGTFVDVICLDTGADKDDVLEFYRDSGMWWIEDNATNASLGADLGLKSILIDHPHNAESNDERVVRASTWTEIVDIIIN